MVEAIRLERDHRIRRDGASLRESELLEPGAAPGVQIIRRSGGPARRAVAALRADALTRSSSLLIVDYLIIGLIGAGCSVIAARGWSPHDVGAVAGIGGATSLIVGASSNGIASTITRFLGGEENQRGFVLEAVLLAVAIGLALTAVVCFCPGHLGVPIGSLGVSDAVAFALIAAYVTGGILVGVCDPAFLSRKEVSYAVAKDIAASLLRIAIIVALIGTGAAGLMFAGTAYVAISGLISLGLVLWRLSTSPAAARILRLSMIRKRLRFAVGSHTASLMAGVPSALLMTIVAAEFGPVEAAYVAMPIIVTTYLTIIPQMTSQALLAELAGEGVDVPRTTVRALRLAYAGTLPGAILLGALAPYVLLVFGHRYSVHGAALLRWTSAATLFSTFNYIGDCVLLARQKLAAYNAVNAGGSVAILVCIFGAIAIGPSWIGPALFVGQILYATCSITALLRFGSASQALSALRTLRR